MLSASPRRAAAAAQTQTRAPFLRAAPAPSPARRSRRAAVEQASDAPSTSSSGSDDRLSRRLAALAACSGAAPEASSTAAWAAAVAPSDAAEAATSSTPAQPSRRLALAAAALLAAAASGGGARQPPAASAAEEAAGSASTIDFVDDKRRYALRVPAAWPRVEKAGADALFEDPERRSTSLGVTVNPVRVRRLQDFGPLEDVGEKLLAAERAKESTLGVKMVAQSARTGAGGDALYDFEYELDSTRGRKRILNTVAITPAGLFIVNGNAKCGAEACGDADAAAIAALRAAAASFDVLPPPS